MCYAFAKIGNDGRVMLGDSCVDIGVSESAGAVGAGGNFAELERLKQRKAHLQLVGSPLRSALGVAARVPWLYDSISRTWVS